MSKKNLNRQPTAGTQSLVQVIEIGWEHDLVRSDSGEEIVYRTDPSGQYIPVSYEIPTRVTNGVLLQAMKDIGGSELDGLFQKLSAGEIRLPELVLLASAIFGEETVLKVAGDPTVETDVFMAFLGEALGTLGLNDALPEAEEGPKHEAP